MGMQWFACADPAVTVSFNLTPQRAVEFMREKSFWIAGIENQNILEAIQSELVKAFNDGTSYKDFASRVQEVIDTLGYTGEKPYRLDTIYDTNLFTAYSQAQLQQVEEVKELFPYWRYVAVREPRTTPCLCPELDGMIFRQGDGPIPPIHHRCKCSPQFIHVSETEGLKPQSEGFVRQIMDDPTIAKFDQMGEHQAWLKRKQEGLNSAIKSAVKSRLKGN